LEFTVIGDTVNVASRLEALTKQEHCSLLMSQTTVQNLDRNVDAISLGIRQLRGRDDQLEVFTLQRTGASKAQSM
jgi:class 3 adenylate cyclase